MSGTPTSEKGAGYRAYVLFILVVVYTFNFIDRQILSILAVPIKAELGLSDTQIGLMSGLAFALFYATLGVPIAILADRTSRVRIMAIALSLWSAMTAVCGLAQNFGQLFLARLGVGVGEAGGVAPAYSLIADYFPPNERARALAIYSLGIPVGSALGIILGGILAELLDWRIAFYIMGVGGLLLAPIFWSTVKEPRRGHYDSAPPAPQEKPLRSVISILDMLTRKPSFWLLSIGAAFSSMMGYGLILWLPSFLVRSFGADLAPFFSFLPGFLLPADATPIRFAAYFYGAVLLVGGTIGIYAGGSLADRFGAKRKSAYAAVPAIAFLLTAPLLAIGLTTPTLGLAFVVFMGVQALSLVWLGPVITAFQHLVPPHMRATASAIFLLINNLIGIGVGQTVTGLMADLLRAEFGDDSLRYSLLAGTSFYLVAAGFMVLAARRLHRDWQG
ncbi:spinster family MFS transporter [Parvularcula lutaonensis]|uniref:Spinster family MFS transporter n=1 Tax=Parvularcula lutaonensis TaxID=491923 RepID=A0ABV7ME62_9PROT|nr:MFS transporter [Parvularcula lutaonensis]GGY49839.1 MFS transporter [Parvularcula lutaonensis]